MESWAAARGGHRLRGGDGVGEARAGDGGGVHHGALGGQGRELGGRGLVGQGHVAARRDGDAGDGQRRAGGDGGGGLKDAVLIVAHRAGGVGQRVQRARAEGVAAQVIGDGETRQGRCAGVGEGDEIRHRAVAAVGGDYRRLSGSEHLYQLTHGNVGRGAAAGVRQPRLVGECCHRNDLPCIVAEAPQSILCSGREGGKGIKSVLNLEGEYVKLRLK